MGTFLMSRECAKFMIRQKNGRIVNYSTVAVALFNSSILFPGTFLIKSVSIGVGPTAFTVTPLSPKLLHLIYKENWFILHQKLL